MATTVVCFIWLIGYYYHICYFGCYHGGCGCGCAVFFSVSLFLSLPIMLSHRDRNLNECILFHDVLRNLSIKILGKTRCQANPPPIFLFRMSFFFLIPGM